MIQFFEENTQGSDYICADIHGCFPALEGELKAVNFNPEVDRLFSLGDLINRGEHSHLALAWLNKPWFHAILGNHELMFMDAFERFKRVPSPVSRFRIAGSWTQLLSEEELQDFYTAFKKLPVAIEVKLTSDKSFGAVHAQLPINFDWKKLRRALSEKNRAYVASLEGELFWQKDRAHEALNTPERIKPVKNIFHVFHGHTILSEFCTVANRTFMDLGSFRSGRVGFLEPAKYLGLL